MIYLSLHLLLTLNFYGNNNIKVCVFAGSDFNKNDIPQHILYLLIFHSRRVLTYCGISYGVICNISTANSPFRFGRIIFCRTEFS